MFHVEHLEECSMWNTSPCAGRYQYAFANYIKRDNGIYQWRSIMSRGCSTLLLNNKISKRTEPNHISGLSQLLCNYPYYLRATPLLLEE